VELCTAGEEGKCVGSCEIGVVRWTRSHSNGEFILICFVCTSVRTTATE
jgi:hypothetical protein